MNKSPLKSYLLVGAGLTGVGLIAYNPSRNKLVSFTKGLKSRIGSFNLKKSNLPIEKAGNPDPEDIEDNKMVSEGAMYSVDYYNKKVQE
ncbi:hypothetical protein JOC95_001130 [Bacillus tianshenii]|uniref:YtxH domain-containing protein n=1 Tax=Sutcliffiella tianshenii TaxID=1463404 RepID=A0ABS2NXA5_9BACI|nr:hypothetical protein [Bacillus tianshenii]MBM7619281.1 hypothetical protein [Bacillus tianshenii]